MFFFLHTFLSVLERVVEKQHIAKYRDRKCFKLSHCLERHSDFSFCPGHFQNTIQRRETDVTHLSRASRTSVSSVPVKPPALTLYLFRRKSIVELHNQLKGQGELQFGGNYLHEKREHLLPYPTWYIEEFMQFLYHPPARPVICLTSRNNHVLEKYSNILVDNA